MSKFAATLAVLMFAVTGSAFAQDYRSPDAKPTAVTQDYRSPDARPTPPPALAGNPAQDLRSPDALPSGRFVATDTVSSAHSSSSFDWGYLAAGIALALIGLGTLTLMQRRRRHGLAIGS